LPPDRRCPIIPIVMARRLGPLCILLVWPAALAAEDRSSQRAALAGVKAFTIETEFAAGSTFAQYVDVVRLRSQAETEVTQAGLPLADRGADANAPFLSIKLEGSCSITFGCYGLVDLRMNWLPMTSEPSIESQVRTVWLDSRTVTSYPAGLTEDVGEALHQMLDAFVADYRAANPA